MGRVGMGIKVMGKMGMGMQCCNGKWNGNDSMGVGREREQVSHSHTSLGYTYTAYFCDVSSKHVDCVLSISVCFIYFLFYYINTQNDYS